MSNLLHLFFNDCLLKVAVLIPSSREETVIALIRLDADPTAVDDPTPAFPGGQSAADLASCRGHKGISGYLAEAFLSRHLSSLNIDQNEMDRDTATMAAEKETDIAAQVASFSSKGELELLSLKGSLAAVRKSARAVALIHAAYRTSSFRQRQLAKSSDDISEISLDLAALGSLNMVQKRGHFEDYLHSAAVKIQQKYRGWKGRKDFLKIRNRIVKIQVLNTVHAMCVPYAYHFLERGYGFRCIVIT